MGIFNLFLLQLIYHIGLLGSVSSLPISSRVEYLFLSEPTQLFDSSQRSIMKRQHILVDHEINNSRNPSKNVRGGDSHFEYVPPSNKREVRIVDFSKKKGEQIQKMKKDLTKSIMEKDPIFEDKEKVTETELALLEKGVWAICKWRFPLPYPLDKDEQCTQSELKFLLPR